VGAIALGATTIAAADDPPITAAIAGVSSPASSDQTIQIQARDTAAKLVSASATVDGVNVGTASLCPADSITGCQAEPGSITFHSTDFADGQHHLIVTITDAAGNSASFPQDFEIFNHPPATSPSATLNINSSNTPQVNGSSPNGGGKGGVEGASESSCTSPKLSMQLSDKPVKLSHGHPVLLKDKRYRFTGKLTCLIGGKRHSAPQRTRVEQYDVVGKKTHFMGGTLVRAKGAISMILTVSSSRTLQFRVTAANGKTTKVSIKVVVTKKKGKG
jgi:hypothetical protein